MRDNKNHFLSNIEKAEKEDLEIMNLLKEDHENYQTAKEVLNKLYLVTKEEDPQKYDELMNYLEKLLDKIDIKEQLQLKEADDIIEDFENLLRLDIDEESIREFIREHSAFFKTKPNKKLKKQIEKYLKSKIRESEITQPGPIITPNETNRLKERLKEYLNSHYFLDFLKKMFKGKIEISIALYGSLVTGFSSAYSKYKGLPSDQGRISDVDMGITINDQALEKITLDGRQLFKKGTYYGPFFQDKAQKLGPFVKIFDFVKDLSFAKRTDRKIAFVIVDKSFYKNNLAQTNHINLITKEIIVN